MNTGFHAKTIFLFGAVIGAANIAVFGAFYVGERFVPLEWAVLAQMVSAIFINFVGLLAALFYLKRNVGKIGFLAFVSHAVLVNTVAAVIHGAFDYTFHSRIEPDYEIRMLESQHRRMVENAQKIDSLQQKSMYMEQALVAEKILNERKNRPPDYAANFKNVVYMYLFIALLFGSILGLLFRNLN